jgi:hypothetical protein
MAFGCPNSKHALGFRIRSSGSTHEKYKLNLELRKLEFIYTFAISIIACLHSFLGL